MTSAPLSSLFYANRGNISDKWEQYLAIYESELRPWHQTEVSLLEIGVQNGGSMQVWAKYFAEASSLVGIDIDPRISDIHHAANVELFVADGTDEGQLFDAIGNRTFDIIIDDGSHFSADIATSFRLLFPRLRPGGRYFIEDLHCSYWEQFGGGLGRREAAIEFLKTFVDVLHSDHLPDLDDLDLDVDEELLLALRKGLARVTFYDSVAVVERLPFEKLEPYRRILAGDEGALVDPLELMGLESPDRLLFIEPLARKLESAVIRRIQQMHEGESKIASIRFEAESLAEQLAAERANAAALEADRNRLDLRSLQAENIVAAERAAARESERDRLESAADSMRALGRTLEISAQMKADAAVTVDAARANAAAATARADELQRQFDEVANRASDFGQAVVSLRNEIEAIERSFTHRLMSPVRLAARLARVAKQRSASRTPDEPPAAPEISQHASSAQTVDGRRISEEALGRSYRRWNETYGHLSKSDVRLIDDHIASGGLPNLVVAMSVNTDDPRRIDAALDALSAQRLPTWTCWIAIPEESRSRAVMAVVERRVSKDARLHLLDDDAVVADDVVVVVTSASTVLREHALYLFAEAVSRGAQLVYGDSEVMDPASSLVLPVFKPHLSPLHQRLHRYIGGTFAVVARSATSAEMVGRCISGQIRPVDLIDALVDMIEPADAERVPFIVQQDLAVNSSRSAAGPPADRAVPPRVSIIIPTRDRLELLEPCIASLMEETSYPRDLLEIIVVDNGSTDQATLDYLRRKSARGDVVVIRDDGDFNYPRLNNRAATVATGEVLVLLNNDTTVLDPEWLAIMVAQVMQPDVGAVGAKLLYPDGSVQHGGVVLGIQGVAAHVNHMLPCNHEAYNPIADMTHEVSAVTGACLAIRADLYRELGGLDQSLAVTFNDIDLCCAAMAAGYRNIYIGEPLIVHHESKSRGYDIKPEQQEAFRREAIRARTKFPNLYRNDPYYNPNLSLVRTYDLAEPPRSVRPWIRARRAAEASRCVLMLSSTHQVGHGVAVVVDLQARHLAALGHRVILGGPRSTNDFDYAGCERVVLHDPVDAARFAVECGADVVMMHTPPFYSTARWLGDEQTKIAYDYGEPDPDLFPDALARRGVLADKQFSMALADRRFAISESVRSESGLADMEVIPLGNAHLSTWSDDHLATRESVRQAMGWADKVVVFNVCRFHGAERHYKGVDAYATLLQVTQTFAPTVARNLVFVLAGKADAHDVQEMEACGLTVFANVSDSEMIDLYAAADIYVNLSKWEGYNLGIGQALAMGLPTMASDIPAHRAFGITTTDDVVDQVRFIEAAVASISNDRLERTARLWSWEAPLQQLAEVLDGA